MSDILIRGGTVIPVDGMQKVIEDGYVEINGNRIASVGKVADLAEGKKYDSVIEANERAVLPGFINAHTHLVTECFRGIVELFPGTFFIFIVKEFISEKRLYDLTMLACTELMRFGTTCTCDNYQRERLVVQAIADSGLRAVVSEQVSEADLLSGIFPAIYRYQPEEARQQLQANEDLIKKWHGAQNGRITCRFGPLASDAMTYEMLQEVKDKAREYGVGIAVHVAQSPREVETMKLRQGITPVEFLEKAGILGPDTIGAHCIHLTENDVTILRESGMHIAHCPGIFIKRGRRTPMMSWLKGGMKNIGLGSDNILHDPFETMRFSNFLALQHVNQYEPDSVHLVPSPWETLEMATIRSARAVGLGEEVGSLEAGKKADVIIIDLQKPHLTPNLDIVANLVHYANGNDVETTIIDGRVVMENRVMKTVDEAEVLRIGQEASVEVWQGFHARYRQFPELAQKLKYFAETD